MGKVIAIGPGGKPQAPERTDRFREVIDLIVGNKMLDRLLLTPLLQSGTDQQCRCCEQSGHDHAEPELLMRHALASFRVFSTITSATHATTSAANATASAVPTSVPAFSPASRIASGIFR